MRRLLASCASALCSETARTAAAVLPLNQQRAASFSLTASPTFISSAVPTPLRSCCPLPPSAAHRDACSSSQRTHRLVLLPPCLPPSSSPVFVPVQSSDPSSLCAVDALCWSSFPWSAVWSPSAPVAGGVECAVPKRRPSPRAQRHRRAGQRAINLTRRYVNYRVCLNCGAAVKPHFLCNRCRTAIARF